MLEESHANGLRAKLTVSMSIRNLLNHANPGPINGDIASPLFGKANQTAERLNGEGFSEAANNRRLELQIRLRSRKFKEEHRIAPSLTGLACSVRKYCVSTP
jgi:hypothetical protein